MLSLFKGQWSVAKTFWIGFVIFNVITNLVLVALNNFYITAEEDQIKTLDTVILSLMIFMFVYLLLMIVAMYRAIRNSENSSFWGWFGLILIFLAVLFRGYNIAIVTFPSIKPSTYFVELEITQLKRSLPASLGAGLTMTDVTFENGTMSYIIKANFQMSDFEVYNLLEMPFGQDLCRDFEGYFRGPVQQVEYVYNLIDGQMSTAMTAKDCLAYLNETR